MSDKSSLQTDEAVKEPMDTQSEFGEKMIQWRENAGLNRKEFARKLNVSLTAVKNWETGHSTPKATKYSEIAKVLGINVRDLGLDNDLDLNEEFNISESKNLTIIGNGNIFCDIVRTFLKDPA